MNGAWYRFTRELRHGGWRFVVLTAVLLGVGGGVALGAIAGARRTSTAFERLESATFAADVLVNPQEADLFDVLTDEVFDAMPGVEAFARVNGARLLDVDGSVPDAVTLVSADGRYGTTVERPVVREGRLPDPSRPDELFADPRGAAAAGLEVGDEVERLVFTRRDAEEHGLVSPGAEELARLAAAGELTTRVRLTLVGIGVRTGDVVPGAGLPSTYVTPAFWEAVDPQPIFGAVAVRLTEGSAGVEDFVRRVRAVNAGVGIDFQTTAGDRATITRAVRPQTTALVAFGVITALGTIAAVAQAFSRRARSSAAVEPTLGGLGMTAPERRRLHLLRLALVAATAPAPMVAVAFALSTIFPVGVARPVEPTRGLDFDPWVLLPGALAMAVAAAGAGAAAVTNARRRQSRLTPSRARIARIARVAPVARAALPPTLTTGARFALGGGTARLTPVTSTMVSAAVGTGVVIAALSFSTSLDEFVTSPRSYGWDFDAVIATGDTTPEQDVALEAALGDTMSAVASVRGWTPAFLQQATVAGGTVPAMGLDEGGGTAPHPTVVTGRVPAGQQEVALGAVTAREAGVRLGDRIPIGFDGLLFDVVGTVILPGIGNYQGSDQAALGRGALFTREGFQIATSLGFQGDEGVPRVLADVVDATADGLARLQRELDAEVGAGLFVVERAFRPSDVEGYAAIRSTPVALAAILGTLAAMTVGHGLIVSVRQRRRDYAVFRSLGFTKGQVMATVGWQASTIAVLGVMIGLPLGLVVGRVAWSAVAHRLGIVDVTVTPLSAVILALPFALVLANVAAAIPARLGVRLRPAEELRAE